MIKKIALIIFLLSGFHFSYAENGYRLWLRYENIGDPFLKKEYTNTNREVIFPAGSEQLQAAKSELNLGLNGLLNTGLNEVEKFSQGGLLIGTPESSSLIGMSNYLNDIQSLDNEGFIIRSVTIAGKPTTLISAKNDVGVLYGIFHYLRLMQTHQSLKKLNIREEPKLQVRILNHWDNLNGTVERGYAGSSIWEWQRLPGYKPERYTDYARANASVGINGAVLNNVNASAQILSTEYLIKVAALAGVFRPYGIKVYLSARFSAPKEIGGLPTADPLDPEVCQWWKEKAKEIYKFIPDFGGFLVKANSEGQPGPQDYGRTHADGANMMAEALKPFGGIVIWRAFVYRNERNIDRAANAYDEFKPLDGKFMKNVLLQVKNGPIDFQPREPFNPLFGAMPETTLSMEFQITQEYMGFSTHLAFLAPLFEETLCSDTDAKGSGTTVSKILTGYKNTRGISGMSGVANIGTDINWCGHPFAQANWYAFGRIAWNPETSSSKIADEWIRMTFSNDESVINPIKEMMLLSREAGVNYRGPLGLTHIMNFATHYGPGPWYKDRNWDAKDYHKADSLGLGVDRTESGSNAVNQYDSPLRERLNSIKTCPQKFLLWFHHVPWNYKMPSGRTMWDELVFHYYQGVDQVGDMQNTWAKLEGKIDNERFDRVKTLLGVQKDEAIWWRNGCLLYFQTFSRLPIPALYEQPKNDLRYYQKIPFPYDWDGTKYQ